MYMCVCVCVCVYREGLKPQDHQGSPVYMCVCVCVCVCVYREGLNPFLQESGSWYPTPERKGRVEV